MFKGNQRRDDAASHVKFTENYASYVTAYDLVNSENFQRIVKQAVERRKRAIDKKNQETDSS